MKKFKVGDEVRLLRTIKGFAKYNQGIIKDVIDSEIGEKYYIEIPFENFRIGGLFSNNEIENIPIDKETKDEEYALGKNNSIKKALNNAIDEIKGLKEQLEYANEQLDQMAEFLASKDDVIRELTELLIENTNR